MGKKFIKASFHLTKQKKYPAMEAEQNTAPLGAAAFA